MMYDPVPEALSDTWPPNGMSQLAEVEAAMAAAFFPAPGASVVAVSVTGAVAMRAEMVVLGAVALVSNATVLVSVVLTTDEASDVDELLASEAVVDAVVAAAGVVSAEELSALDTALDVASEVAELVKSDHSLLETETPVVYAAAVADGAALDEDTTLDAELLIDTSLLADINELVDSIDEALERVS